MLARFELAAGQHADTVVVSEDTAVLELATRLDLPEQALAMPELVSPIVYIAASHVFAQYFALERALDPDHTIRGVRARLR